MLNSPLAWAQHKLVKCAIQSFEKGEFETAKMWIDKAMMQPEVQRQGSSWYYRGVICEQLLRQAIHAENSADMLQEVLASYRYVGTLLPQASQYYSYAQTNLKGLWAYYLDRGQRYYKQEAFAQALVQFEKCQTIAPEAYEAYLYAGLAAQQLAQYDQAMHSYDRCLALGGQLPAVYIGLADLWHTQGDDKEKAHKLLDKGIQQHPFNHDLLHKQWELGHNREDWEAQWETTQQQAHDSQVPAEAAACYYRLGYYQQQTHLELAITYYQQAIRILPKQMEPWRQLGMVYYNQAAQLSQAWHEKSQEIPQEEEDQANAEKQQEAVEEAKELQRKAIHRLLMQSLEAFEKTLHINPQDPFTLQQVYHLYIQLEQAQKATHIAHQLERLSIEIDVQEEIVIQSHF